MFKWIIKAEHINIIYKKYIYTRYYNVCIDERLVDRNICFVYKNNDTLFSYYIIYSSADTLNYIRIHSHRNSNNSINSISISNIVEVEIIILHSRRHYAATAAHVCTALIYMSSIT